MKSTIKSPSLAVLAGIALSSPAFAVVNIDYVSVGHAGNTADPATGSLYGAVAYAYNIGKYEVTNAQYAAFLNAVNPNGTGTNGVGSNGIYNVNMGTSPRGGISFNASAASGEKYTIRTSMGDKPVNFVSWYDAARFTNWLHNGQGSGSTETGAYTLNGNTGFMTRNVGATVWLPSADEWHKAAYYQPSGAGGDTDNYWDYATQSNTAPTVATANASGDISNSGANVANYFNGADWNGQDGNLTTVGSAEANNYFGTEDMNGNVFEWTDFVNANATQRGLRGGSYSSLSNILTSLNSSSGSPTSEIDTFGFRVAAIPEPSAFLLSVFAVGASLLRRRRHSH